VLVNLQDTLVEIGHARIEFILSKDPPTPQADQFTLLNRRACKYTASALLARWP
jgi:hypothetical protein